MKYESSTSLKGSWRIQLSTNSILCELETLAGASTGTDASLCAV